MKYIYILTYIREYNDSYKGGDDMIIKLNVNDEEFDALWNGLKLFRDASQYLTYGYQEQCIKNLVDPLICMMDEAYNEAKRGRWLNEGKL